ncbi:hypothetical protein MBESOW_P1947 [Sphingobium xenophagum]|jgi:hypothetical protein|uniref:Uncharacterized protein n=5 Tax=Sphingomonadaceae TaxID=41297 RepID=A0A401J235_SPHXE|nr:hypothetical protein MBESOW_P1947 [Sphingobium xenophagum]|tara:strand:+ start:1295 stop:1579 length:285 start_codon:yes stop_codon:yes gene_type:complete
MEDHMIVISGLRWKVLAASAPACCDPADVCREAVEHCNALRVGIDVSFRDNIIEARPGSDPAQLADIFERRAAELAKPVGSPSSDHVQSQGERP